MKKYIVRLTQAQRQFLSDLAHATVASTHMIGRARILLKADQGEQGPGWHDQQIIDALEVGHDAPLRETLAAYLRLTASMSRFWLSSESTRLPAESMARYWYIHHKRIGKRRCHSHIVL